MVMHLSGTVAIISGIRDSYSIELAVEENPDVFIEEAGGEEEDGELTIES